MGLFSRLFGRGAKRDGGGGTVVEYSGGASRFDSWSGNIYDSDVVRAAIWTNAKNAGKLSPKHVRRLGDKYEVFPMPRVKRILTRPNPYMSMSVFLEKMVTQCLKKNNAFALIKFGSDGWVEGIYPIGYTTAEAVEREGFYFVKFTLADGSTLTEEYAKLIHIRMHFDEKDLFGESNAALSTVMDVVQTTDRGVIGAIRNGAVIRWLLKFTSVLNPADKQIEVEKFVANYLSIENTGGAAATDPRYEAIQVKPESYVPDAKQMSIAKERIYSYFGLSEAIIQSKFTEYEWNAYYENTIEPFAIQLSEEFTEKIFTQHEREFGNEVIFESNRLQYASATSKLHVAQFLANISAVTLDQVLEIFNMAPIGGEDGARRVQTLNMVNAAIADQYQLDDEPEPNKTKEVEDDE